MNKIVELSSKEISIVTGANWGSQLGSWIGFEIGAYIGILQADNKFTASIHVLAAPNLHPDVLAQQILNTVHAENMVVIEFFAAMRIALYGAIGSIIGSAIGNLFCD